MKTLLRSAVAAIALVSVAGVAQAQTAQLHYAGPLGYTSTNPGLLGAIAAETAYQLGVGTKYTAVSFAAGNTTGATSTVSNTWTMTGTVSQDCSFYAGNNSAARDITLGTIGVRTGNNENVSNAFDMVAPATANVFSATAGCNTNNDVTITKLNANNGLVNSAAGGYDSNEFQANIPYSIAATFTGTTNTGAGAPGTGQTLNVAANQGSAAWAGGAWRSSFNMAVAIPTPSRALVAGNYSDQITVVLAAQ